MSQSIHIHEDTNREVIWKCIISYKKHQLGCHHPVDTLCLQGTVGTNRGLKEDLGIKGGSTLV